MKILLGAHHFLPSTGGIETSTDLLAREFTRLGHQVHVITQTEGNGDFPFAVVRRPRPLDLLGEVRWCDVFLQNNISLRTLWPLVFVRRPLFVAHQTWIAGDQGQIAWPHRAKRFVLRFAKSLTISRAISERLPTPSVQVGNPYDDEVFKDLQFARRDRDLIFVGRLVSDKGADVLLGALAILRAAGVSPSLTVVGDGPERERLATQVVDLGLRSSVEFVGRQDSRSLAEILNRHRILVVPSRWAEPLGIVAIEGIACGCVVVGSAEGGLPEAIGPCGVTFPNGDAGALAQILKHLLVDPPQMEAFRRAAPEHLVQFTRSHVANRYLEAMTAT